MPDSQTKILRPVLLLAALLLVAAALLFSVRCSESANANGESIQLPRATAVESLDPALASSVDDLMVAAAVFNGLTQLQEDGSGWIARGDLAESWAAEDGGESWLFTLKPDRQFSDGSAVDVAAVVASFERAKAANGYAASLLRDLVRVDAENDATVRLSLARAQPNFPQLLAHPSLGITADGRTGSGGYKLAAEQQPAEVVLLANSKSSRPPSQFSEVRFVRIPVADQLAALERGDIIAMTLPAAEALEGKNSVKWVAYSQSQSAALVYLAFNLRQPELQSLPLRRALSSAINYNQLPAVISGQATPLGNFFPPAVAGYSDRARLPVVNVAAAKQWAQSQAELPKLQLLAPAAMAKTANALVESWRLAGLKVAKRVVAEADYNAALAAGDYQLLLRKTHALTPDSTALLLALFGDPEKRGTQNFSGYRNPAIWQLLDSASISDDPERRQQLMQTALREIGKAVAAVPLYSPHLMMVAATGVPQLPLNPFTPGTLPLNTLVREKDGAAAQ